MAAPIRVRNKIEIPEGELRWRFIRASGPGGQHVNKTSTAVELSFDVARSPSLSPLYRKRALQRLEGRLVDGVLTVRAEEHRSQIRNRESAREKLAAALDAATAPPPRPRKPTRPSRGAKERRLQEKKRRSEIKRGRSGRWES